MYFKSLNKTFYLTHFISTYPRENELIPSFPVVNPLSFKWIRGEPKI